MTDRRDDTLEIPDPTPRRPGPAEKMLRFFSYEHLPDHLQDVSAEFAHLARKLVRREQDHGPSPELTVAMRRLLESKDCAVRSAL